MHLDVTPARRTAPKEKQGVIAHAKKGANADPPRYVAMNAFGFGDWYSARTPVEERFAKALNSRLYEQAGIPFAADADVCGADQPRASCAGPGDQPPLVGAGPAPVRR
jgi:hypothetical protein